MKSFWAYICFLLCGCVSPKIPSGNLPVIPSKATDIINAVSPAVSPSASHGDLSSGNLLYTYAGVGLFILGALTSAFWDKKSGLILILCGVFAGAVPFVINSTYFAWISAGTLLSLAACGVWWVRWKVKHEADQEEQEDNQTNSTDAQKK
jgi:hypothetical protein